MTPATTHLSDDLIERLLSDRLSEDERLAAECHVEGCVNCRQQVEASAGGPGWWEAATMFLACRHFRIDDSGEGAEPIESTAPFRVEQLELASLLTASEYPQCLGRIGNYDVTGVVGAGGMGIVVKAIDHALSRTVAIKLLRPSLASSARARQRFAREAQAAAAVVHQNVIEIHGVDRWRGVPYLVMQYVSGESLAKRLARCGPLSLVENLRIASQMAEGLAAAHARGLIHRDIKPSNILLDNGTERLRLTDFGLARAASDAGLTVTGSLAGTPEYMSPEQAQGAAIDERSDLFSFGSVLYTMCTGRPPFQADSCFGVIHQIVESAPATIQAKPSRVPKWMAGLIARLLAKHPDDRIQSAETLATILRQCLAHAQHPSHPLPRELHAAVNPRARFKKLRSLVVATCLAAVVVAGMLLVRHKIPYADESRAPREAATFANTDAASPSSIDQTNLRWNDDVAETLMRLRRSIGEME